MTTQTVTGEGLTFPLSYAQQRLYFLHEWDPANGTYPFPVNLRLTGPLDVPALRAALADVVDRHWVLRSSVENRDGVVVQVVGPNRFRLRFEDLCGLDDERRAARLAERVTEEATKPFSLTGPLLRGRLLAVANHEHVLLLTFHHIVFDGWSYGVLAEELDVAYRRHAFGEDTALPTPALQYGELAERQRRGYEDDPRRATLEAYWRERLLPLPERLALPTVWERPETLSGRTGRAWLRLDAELSEGLAAQARSCRSTLAMLLLAAYEVVLCRMSGQVDFCVGGASAGRTTPESQALIGTFVNEVVYRSDTRAGDTFADLMSRVRGTALGVYRHDALPFERLVELLAPPREVGYHPLFQHSLAVQPNEAGDEGIQLRGLRVDDFDTPPEGSALDLAVSFHWAADALVASVDYSRDLWNEDWGDGFARVLHAVLRAVAENPDFRIDDLPLPLPHVVPAVPAVPAEPAAATTAPPVAAAAVMAGIWAEVLSRPSVDWGDNFFDIGGDSLLVLTVVAKANAAGFGVRVRDVFRWQTVAELVEGVSRDGQPAAVAAEPLAPAGAGGPVPLLPIQSWFLSGGPEVGLGHWNYTILYKLSRPAVPGRLAAAVRAALDQHDATRLRFGRNPAGRWEQYYTDGPGADDLRTVDLTGVDRDRVGAALVEIAAHAQGELRPGTGGPLIKAVHLVVAPDDHRLLLAAHHLVTDPASARILSDDIGTAYGQLTRGKPVTLLAQRNTYRDWGEGLSRLAADPLIRAEIPYWTSVATAAVPALPVDRPPGINDVASQVTMSFELDEDTTRRIRDVTARHQVTLTEALLATLGASLGERLGDRPLLIDMETQGRDDLVDGVDVTRTVGWFTALFPMVLPTGAAASGVEGLRRVADGYRAVPHNGLGFGLLSEMTGDVTAPPRALGFTYLGAFDGGAGATGSFLVLDELPPDTDRASWMLRRHEVEAGAVIFDGRLEFSYTYSSNRYAEETIRDLGERWRSRLTDLAGG